MTAKLNENSKVLSVRVSSEMKECIKVAAGQRGLTPCVYVRTLLYDKFSDAQ